MQPIGRPTVATWISVDHEKDATFFPQLGNIKSSDPRVHFVYWRCVAIFFATAHRMFGDLYQLVLYTNLYAPGDQIAGYLRSWNVEIRELPINHLPPVGYFGAWSNQFYILDIIQDLASREDGQGAVVLDSDCVFTGSLERLFDLLALKQVLTYDVGEDPDLNINGLTRREMGPLFEEYGSGLIPEPDRVPRYYGGEFFAASSHGLRQLGEAIEPVWQESLRRNEAGKRKFNEEAHFLSFLYYQLGYEAGTANKLVKRFWTGTKNRNGLSGDENLPIWHVPAEKKYGLARLYPAVQDPGSWFWTMPVDGGWRRRMQLLLGVPRPSLSKQAQDYLVKILANLKLHKDM